jgi:WD40 repeat protein
MTPAILSPDEHFLFSTGRDGAIEIRSLFSGQTEATLAAGNWGVAGMAFSPDGSLFATASAEGTVTLWNPSERKAMDVLRGHLLGVHAAAFSPDGQRIASGSHGSEAVKLWDVVTRQEVATLGGQGSMFSFVKFAPGGRMLVAINRQKVAHIWRAPSLAEIEAAERTLAPASP